MTSLSDVPLILTTAEGAKLVRRSTKTLRRMVRDGLLPAARPPQGGPMLFQRDDLLRAFGIELPEESTPSPRVRGSRR